MSLHPQRHWPWPLAGLFRLTVTGAMLLLVAACNTTPSRTPVKLSSTQAERFEDFERRQMLAKAGAIAIPVTGVEGYAIRYWLNNVPLAVQHQGYISLPVMPGNYSLRYQQNDFTWAPLSVDVFPGKTTYVVLNDSWLASSPYITGSRKVFLNDLRRKTSNPPRVVPDNPVQAFLPLAQQALLTSCMTGGGKAACQRVLDDIPKILIEKERRKEIAVLANPATAVAKKENTPPIAKQVQKKTIAVKTPAKVASLRKEPVKATKTEWDLPPNIQRDRLVVQISDLFKAGKAAQSLPYFGQLDILPVPIDPATNFYWAQALFANGEKSAAFSKLTRFIKTIDSSSRYYEPAIRLLTKIKG